MDTQSEFERQITERVEKVESAILELSRRLMGFPRLLRSEFPGRPLTRRPGRLYRVSLPLPPERRPPILTGQSTATGRNAESIGGWRGRGPP